MRLVEPRLAVPDPTEPVRASMEEIEEIARSRMEGARIDILLDHPYFAAALLAIPMRGTFDEAIAHAVLTDGSRIVYRFDLVAALERPRVRLLILHALTHVLLRHPERGEERNWGVWTEACDIAVDLLFEELAVDRQHDREYLQRFKDLSAEAIYDKLVSNAVPRPSSAQRSRPADGMQRPPRDDSEGRTPAGSSESGDDSEAFERAMAETERPTKFQLDGLQRDFAREVEGRPDASRGSEAGNLKSEIDAAGREQVCWQHVLARFMRETIDREWSFSRPNRKHLWRGIYLPGPVEINGGRFVVAIDTSGSMSDHSLGVMLGEIDAIRRTCACDLTVLQFDAQIHAVAEFSRWSDEDEAVGSTKMMRVYGRGGTDLCLPFTWAEKERRNGREISAMIVCTDGFGPLPSAAPAGLPVLFALTPLHQAPSFGELLVLGQREQPVPTAQVAADPAPGGAGPDPTNSGTATASQVVSPGSCMPRASRGGFTRSYGRMI